MQKRDFRVVLESFNICSPVLLNMLTRCEKKIKCSALSRILSLFPNFLNKFNEM